MIIKFKLFENISQITFKLNNLRKDVLGYGFDDNFFYKYLIELFLNSKVVFTCISCDPSGRVTVGGKDGGTVIDIKCNAHSFSPSKFETKKIMLKILEMPYEEWHVVSWTNDITIYNPTIGELGRELEKKRNEKRFDL